MKSTGSLTDGVRLFSTSQSEANLQSVDISVPWNIDELAEVQRAPSANPQMLPKDF